MVTLKMTQTYLNTSNYIRYKSQRKMQRNSFWYNIDMEDLTMGRIERDELEYKQSVSNTFLKTVIAFANYRSGEIVFGISDAGEIIGVSNLYDQY